MKSDKTRNTLLPLQSLGLAVLFGLAGYLTMWANITSRIPGSGYVTDVREIFVVLGSALTGPIGGALIGFMSAATDPIPQVVPYSIVQHLIGGMWVGFVYRRLCQKRQTFSSILPGWIGIVLSYYALAISSITVSNLLDPQLAAVTFGKEVTVLGMLKILSGGALIECAMTIVVSSGVLLVLPVQYRAPRWGQAFDELNAGGEDRNAGEKMYDTQTVSRRLVGIRHALGDFLSEKVVVIALIVGTAAMLVVSAHIGVTIPWTDVTTDARDILVLVCSAITGPIGGIIAGSVSGMQDPNLDFRWFIVLQNIAGGIWIGWSYKALVNSRKGTLVILSWWVTTVFVFYFVIPIPVLLFAHDYMPAAFKEIVSGGSTFVESLGLMLRVRLIEFIPAAIVTSIILYLVPDFLRKPLWSRTANAPPEAQKTNRFGARPLRKLAGLSLGIRLTIWFLIISIIPLLVVGIFIRDDVATAFINLDARQQLEIARTYSHLAQSEGLEAAANDMRKHKTSAAHYLFIVDRNGTYIAHTDSSKIGSVLSRDFAVKSVERILSDAEFFFVENESGNAIGHSRVKNMDISVVSVENLQVISHALANLESLSNIKVATSLIIISLIGGFVIWIIVGRPMRKLTWAAQQVGHGNLQATVDPTDMEDEIRVLANAFNEMTDNLRITHEGMESEIASRRAAEAALLLREQQFRLLAEYSTDMISRHDLDGKYLYVSPACRTVLGYEPAEVLSRSALEFAMPEDQEIVRNHFQVELKQNSSSPLIYRARRKDGSIVWIEATTRLLFDAVTGTMTEIHVSSRDVTQRREAELALLESESRLLQAQRIANSGNWELNLVSRMMWGSEEAFKIYGIERVSPELPLGDVENVVIDEDRPELDRALSDLMAGNGKYDQEFRIVRVNDKAVRIVHSNAELVRDGQGTPLRIAGTIQDVTERRKMEEAVRESDRMYKTLVEQSADAIYVLQNNRLVFVNPAWERTFGYSSAEALSEEFNLLWLVAPDSQPVVEERFRRYAAGAELPLRYEMQGRRKDGALINLDVSVARIEWIGKPAIQGVYRDITEQKRSEEVMRQSQKTESLGVLAGGVAHDFNNLLQAMLGHASLALKKLPNSSPAYGNIAKAQHAAERASELTRQLLAYSGRGKFDVKPMNINSLIRENLRFLEVAIHKSIKLQEELAEDLAMIDADAGQIQQVVMNLIINASEAIGERSGHIQIRTSMQTVGPGNIGGWMRTAGSLSPGRYCLLEVSDNGAGMGPETLNKVFDPFFTTKRTGRGLGLSAVVGIVKGHHGGMQVESKIGRGTTFRLIFPPSAQSGIIDGAGRTRGQDFKYHRYVLVIDDEADVRDVVADMLNESGIKTILAHDGESGVETYKSRMGVIGLVVLDLSMPGIGGKETFRRLRAVNPNVKVVLTSGYSETEATEDLAKLGLAGFIQKPYRWDKLRETINHLLRDH